MDWQRKYIYMIKFIKQLFCKHDWFYDNRMIDISKNERKGVSVSKECSKCGKVIKF